MAAPVKKIEDPLRHRSQELQLECAWKQGESAVENKGRAAQSALPLVEPAQLVSGRPNKTSYKEQAVAKEYRLPLVGKPEWKPAEANGTKISLDREGPSHGDGMRRPVPGGMR